MPQGRLVLKIGLELFASHPEAPADMDGDELVSGNQALDRSRADLQHGCDLLHRKDLYG
jgi:hypothetical protein